MNKMASRIVDKWLMTASLEDDMDMDHLAARQPKSTGGGKHKNKDHGYRGKGKRFNAKRYKWFTSKKDQCWSELRPEKMSEQWKIYKEMKEKDGEKAIRNKEWYDFFKKETADDRAGSLCYHKDPEAPGVHEDLEGMPKTKNGPPSEKGPYNRAYWKRRVKRVKPPKATKATTKKKAASEHYPWDECMEDQIEQYNSEEMARRVCGKIRAQSQGLGKYHK